VTDGHARLDIRRSAPYFDQDYGCRHHRNRRRRMHRDAQRAMVCIPVQRVHMSRLDYGQHRQQRQAEKSGCPKSAWLPAAASAEICL